MKQLSLFLSILSLVLCAVLFVQNSGLKSDLNLLTEELKVLADSQGAVSTKKGVSKSESVLKGDGKSSPRFQKANKGNPRRASRRGLGARTTDGDADGTEAMLESMLQKQEMIIDRMSDAIDAFAEQSGIAAEDHEQIKSIVLDTLDQQHAIRIELQTGERDREEGRELLIGLRAAQEAALLDVVEQSTYDELMLAIRAVRAAQKRER